LPDGVGGNPEDVGELVVELEVEGVSGVVGADAVVAAGQPNVQ
jgi:hypothetical protein